LQPPSNHRCQSLLSVPLAKISSLPLAQAQTVGAEVITPPRLSQPCQAPSHHMCHNAESVPLAKISILFGPQLTAVGSLEAVLRGIPMSSSRPETIYGITGNRFPPRKYLICLYPTSLLQEHRV